LKNIATEIQSETPKMFFFWTSIGSTKVLLFPFFFPKKLLMGVSENRGTPKSSILIGISSINPRFWGTTILGNTPMASTNIQFLGSRNSLPASPMFALTASASIRAWGWFQHIFSSTGKELLRLETAMEKPG